MGQDEAIKYNSLYKEVELAITNIANLGFDTSELVAELKEIHNEVYNNVKVTNANGAAEVAYFLPYTNGMGKLNKLSVKLEKYDVYVKAQNICEYINMKLESDISSSELDKIISKMIYVLKLILNSPTIDYDNEKHIVEKIYETAYNVIKLELLQRGDSQLFLFVSSNDVNISYFNTLILKDMEKVDLKDGGNRELKTKYHELGERGIYSNYLNLGLIKLILLTDKDCNLKDTLVKKTKDLAGEIIEDTANIASSRSTLNYKVDKINKAQEKLNKNKKVLKDRIASLLLTVTLVSSGAFGIAKLAKTIEKYSAYGKEILTYSTKMGTSKSNEGNVLKYDAKPEDSVILRIYDDNQTGNSYSYQEYELKDVKYDDIEGYCDYAKDNYDVDADRVEVVRTHYYREFDSSSLAGLAYIFYILILLMADAGTMSSDREDYSWIGYIRIKNILKKYRAVKDEEKDVNKLLDELKVELNDVMDRINHNEKLRKRFNELYEENKFLLDNPEKLLMYVNDIDQMNKVEDIKRLVRGRE